MAKTDKRNKTQGAPQTDTPYLSADERAPRGKRCAMPRPARRTRDGSRSRAAGTRSNC
jgi:hypothetical protein